MSIFLGVSKCPICEDILDNRGEFLLYPNITTNKKEDLFLFSDRGIHLKCLNEHPLKEKAMFFLKKYNDFFLAYQQRANPREIITIGLLTSDETEPLYKYNFTLLEKNSQQWGNKQDIIQNIHKFINSNKWESLNPDYNYLLNLIDRINH
jgi:hypothetical protein